MYSGRVPRRNSRSPGIGRVGARRDHHIGDETLLAAVISRDDDAFRDLGVPVEDAGDLVRLDPVAADLDLIVHPAQEGILAIRQLTGQVAGQVHPGPGLVREGVRNESLRGEIGPMTVPARESRAADAELPRLAGRNRLQPLVEQADTGPADGRPIGGRALEPSDGGTGAEVATTVHSVGP